MKNSRLQLLLAILTLIVASALEEILPKFFGVGAPLLLMATVYAAVKRPLAPAVIFAVAAGAAEDAISSLPMMTSVSYFALLSLLTHWAKEPWSVAILGYVMYQFWLLVWLKWGTIGNVFARALMAIPVALVTAFAVSFVLNLTVRGVALEEEG